MSQDAFAKISDEQDERWGAAMEDEVAVCVHGGFPLPIDIEREDKSK